MRHLRTGGAIAALMVISAAFTAAAHSAPAAPSEPVRATRTFENPLAAQPHDTIVPVFSALADTVVSVTTVSSLTGPRGAIVVRTCGTSKILLRLYKYAAPSALGVVLYADTVPVVSCGEKTIPPGTLAFKSCDSVEKAIGFDGTKTSTPAIDSALNGCWDPALLPPSTTAETLPIVLR